MEIAAGELAKLIGTSLEGDPDTRVTGIATVDDAVPGDVVLADSKRYFEKATESSAACIIVSANGFVQAPGKVLLVAGDPAGAFIKALELWKRQESVPAPGVAESATVEQGVAIGKDVAVGAYCYVAAGSRIGNGTVLYSSVHVGRDVTIGAGSKLYPGVVVYSGCTIGARFVAHANAVIGSDGFGYRCTDLGQQKFPHVGTVVIGDDVEIGANTTIDRAKTGATVIGDGTKIDNLVQVAHNVKIGRNCVVAALTGIAGSVEIGDNVTLAAQTGVKDHVSIGSGSVAAARSGVIGDIPAGSLVSGFPAREHASQMRVEAVRLHLPELLARVRDLEEQVRSLKAERDEIGK
jgi:UDP-3-O-[3-hydroxymyristoyl] glucosamine N-acyltransferase